MKKNTTVNEISDSEKTILGVIGSLESNSSDPETSEYIINEKLRVMPNSEGIMKFGVSRIKDFVDVFESSLSSLVTKELLFSKNRLYSLTDQGKEISKVIRKQWFIDFYNDGLIRSAESQAHAIFCEKVFGKNLCQYNVLDMEQLETMLKKLNLQPEQLVLDIGCGLGKITEYIAEQTGASIIGIDNAAKVVEWAQENTKIDRRKLEFQEGDLNNLQFPKEEFDAIISIDTLYYAEDFEQVINKLNEILKPNGQMGIFYAQSRSPEESIETIDPENTKVGTALTKNNLPFTTIDFTENGRGVWIRELATAQELEEMFKDEGNQDLCNERIEQSKDLIQRIDKQLEKRYFFHVQK